MSLPDTITHPETFKRNLPAGHDGVFDWSFTQGCFGETKITPMDLDAVVERHGEFLVFETKAVGKDIPKGQLITLTALHALGCVSIMIIYGKCAPESGDLWFRGSGKRESFVGVDEARALVSRWFEWADKKR